MGFVSDLVGHAADAIGDVGTAIGHGVESVVNDPLPYLAIAGAAAGGLGAMGALGDGAAAGGLGADGLAAADAAGGLLPEFGTAASYGAGLGDLGATGLGALGADSFGGLGSGMFGTGVTDIGSLMGTAGASPFSLGTGLSGIGESLGASGLGDLFGSIGSSAINSLPDVLGSILNPSASPYSFGNATPGIDSTPTINNTSPTFGTDTSQVDMGTGIDQAPTDPFANETAKFARQNAMDPGSFWDQQMSIPTVDLGNQSFGDKLLQKAKDTAIKEGIKSLLGPAQPQMPVGIGGNGMSNMPQQRPLDRGAPVGALSQVQPLPNPFGYNNLTQTLLGHAPTIDTRNARFLSAKDFQ